MSVKTISKDELRRMEDSEGLILQGCGGSLDEWVDGINDMLTEDGILLNGTKFHDCSTFEHDRSTCLLFPFKEDVELDILKLTMWRLQTHGNFGGTWLSDYVPNKLGGFISKEQTAETAQKRSWFRQRRCATASVSPATITRRSASSESMSTLPHLFLAGSSLQTACQNA